MMRLLPTLFIFLFLVCRSVAQPPAPQQETRTVQALFVSRAPVIDGTLDEPVWDRADQAYDFRDKQGNRIRARTYIRFLCDKENLYIGGKCYEPQTQYIRARATPEKLEGFWLDDLVEFRFDILNRPAPHRRYCRFAINASGTVKILGAVLDDPERLCSTAVSVRSNGFVAEASVPLRLLGVERLDAEARWGLNIRRLRGRGMPKGGDEVFWCNPALSFDDPTYFGTLVLGPTGELAVWRLNLPTPRIGLNNFASAGVRNVTDHAVTVGFTATVGDPTPPASATRTTRPGRTHVVQASYDIIHPTPTQKVTFQLREEATGEVFYQASIPIDIPPPVEIELRRPRYGGLLFPDTRLLRAELYLNIPPRDPRTFIARSEIVCSATTGTIKIPERRIQPGPNPIVYPARDIPLGPAEWRVSVYADDVLFAKDTLHMARLAQEEIASLPAYIDRNNRLIVNGEPFFPIGWYGRGDLEHLAELADSPFNCILDYGMNRKSPREVQAYLDAAHTQGMKIIYCMNDVYPGASYIRKMGDWKTNEEIAQGVVTTWKNHPAIIAWYVNDELPVSKVPDMTRYYQMFRRLDRGHPTLLVHCDQEALRPFRNTADIIGIDAYPIPGDPRKVGRMINEAIRATAGQKPVWAVLQAFAWYQYRPADDPSAEGDRGRIPTSFELATGRPPNRSEIRCMTYLALTEGAMGILYYSYYDMRVLPRYEYIWRAVRQVAQEVKTLSPYILQGHRRRLFFRRGGDSVTGVSFVLGEEARVLVANPTRQLQDIAFRLPPGSWAKAEIMFSRGETFAFDEYSIEDRLPPLATRVYKLLSPAAVDSVSETR